MTVNRIVSADLAPPFASRPTLDAWNSASAALPGLVNFLQPSVDTARIEADGTAALYDRKARAWWRSTDEVEAGVLGPVLQQVGRRASLAWPETNDVNPLRSPAGIVLPAQGTIVLVVELADYDSACTLFESETTTGNYVKIAVNASGEIEVTGAAAATLAKTADITPYDGPALIMFSWSGSACKVSLNGAIGATTSGAYVPNADRLDLGAGLDDGSLLHAALILDVDFHASAYDSARDSFITATSTAFGLPFEVEWDFADLGAGKLWLDLNPVGLSDGDVGTWTDGASGIAFTESTNRPSKASADFNGLPSVSFDRSNADRLRNLSPGSAMPAGSATSELHVLVDQLTDPSETSTVTLIGYGATGTNLGRQIQRTSNGTTNGLRATTNGTSSNINGGIDFSGKHVVGARWEAGVEYLYANGALKASIVTPFATATSRFAVGCSPSSSSSPVGFITAKIQRVIGAKDITDAERDLIHGKLAFLGGIQDKLPAGHPYKRATFV